MLFANETSFTSSAYHNKRANAVDLYLTVTGPGPVAIEQLGEDDTWRSFPETTFDGPIAQIVTVRPGKWRVVISGGPTTVEVHGWHK
jgi:hypothetical protein